MLVERLDEGLDRVIAVGGNHAILDTDLGKLRRLHHQFPLEMKTSGLPWRKVSLMKWMARPDLLNAPALSPPKQQRRRRSPKEH